MEKVTISHDPGKPLYCPFCGTCTIPELVEGQEPKFGICDHLLYIGTGEGGFEYVNKEYSHLFNREDMGGDELAKLDIDNSIHFSLNALPPSSFESFVAYTLNI